MPEPRDADPHAALPPLGAGALPGTARAGLVLVHGRGGSAGDMIALAGHVAGDDVALVAPQAAGGTWYPQSFLAPEAANQPGLSSGLKAIARAIERLAAAGLPAERIALLGFSQGACLMLEFLARTGGGFAGVLAFSGALIGRDRSAATPRADLRGYPDKELSCETRLDGLPIFLGCHERDPHIPLARFETSAAALREMGADVITHVIPGAGHGIVADEVRHARELLAGIGRD